MSGSSTSNQSSSATNINNNNNNDDDNQIIHSGYLTKQGGNIQNWKIRWFVLKKGSLSYYLSPVNWEYTKPRGIIYLTKKTEVKEVAHRNRRHCFSVNPNYILENQSILQKPSSTSPTLRSSSDTVNNSNTTTTTTAITTNTSNINKLYPNTTRVYLISAQTVFDKSKWIEMIKLSLNQEKTNIKSILKANHQLEKVKDLVYLKGRKESVPTYPSLLNRTIASESLNDLIKVHLSKKRFYFYHDNLTLPSLSYIDSESPVDLQEIHHQHLVILQQQKDELNKKLKNIQQQNGNNGNNTIQISQSSSVSTSSANSKQVSPSISPTYQSPSVSPLSTSPNSGRKFTMFLSTSPTKSQPPRPSSPTNIPSSSVQESPFYNSAVTRLPLISTSVGMIGTNGALDLQSMVTTSTPPSTTPRVLINSHNTNPIINNTTVANTLISSSVPNSSFSTAYNQLVANSGVLPQSHRHQPKIVVFHLVRDSFQISNIGGCSFNFEILSPFDQNFTLNFVPSSGTIQKGESLTVLVELMAYTHIETDIYSTLHIIGGIEFTLFCRIETDPYLPLFLKSCSGTVLSNVKQKKMELFIRQNPTMVKQIQELAHTMISDGRNVIPIQLSNNNNGWNIDNNSSDTLNNNNNNNYQPSPLQSFSLSSNSSNSAIPRVKLSKYILNYQRNQKKNSINEIESVKIYQLLNDKFLISNSGSADASFQFHFPSRGKKNNLYSLSIVPTNGTVSKGEWFYIKSTLTVFVETEISEIIQLIINQREVHHILITVKCENIHPGNKEIDLDKEVTLHERLGTGATGDIYRGLISQENLNYHISDQDSNGNRTSNSGHNWLIARNPSNDTINGGGVGNNATGGPQILVAVKKLHPLEDPSPEIIQDFYNEVRVLSMFNHPNVVKYVGGCTKIGNWSIVMEYVPGGNLMDVLANPVLVIPYKLVLRMALDIAKGLHYLHSLGILHLDMKSPNLLVSSLSTSAKVNIKVADFNTCINRSRITAGFFNRNSVISNNNKVEKDSKKGTTLWMAPEVIRGAMYSEKCDVYSFGIIMWEMVTRKLPYSHISFNCEVEDQVIKGLRPPIPIHCNKNYTDLMEQCWDDDPEKRPYFDTIIHSLSKMLEDIEIAEQKSKASFKGLRRTQSNSMLNLAALLPSKIIQNPETTTTTTTTTTIASSDSGINLITGQCNSDIGASTTNKLVGSDTSNNINFDSPVIIATKDLQLLELEDVNGGSGVVLHPKGSKFVHSKHKSKRFSYDGGSSTTSILTLNNDSNLPFKFSPPSTPQSSFLQLKKLDKELKTNLQSNTMKHSFIRYRPSFTNVGLISQNSNNQNVSKNSNTQKQ